MALYSWININFKDIHEGNRIRSSTTPNSQQHLGHPHADRDVVGIVLHKGNTPESTTIDIDGSIEPLAYDLGNDVIQLFEKEIVNARGLLDREVGKKRKRVYFGKIKINFKDINYLKKLKG